jgi:hypothetical protein
MILTYLLRLTLSARELGYIYGIFFLSGSVRLDWYFQSCLDNSWAFLLYGIFFSPPLLASFTCCSPTMCASWTNMLSKATVHPWSRGLTTLFGYSRWRGRYTSISQYSNIRITTGFITPQGIVCTHVLPYVPVSLVRTHSSSILRLGLWFFLQTITRAFVSAICPYVCIYVHMKAYTVICNIFGFSGVIC